MAPSFKIHGQHVTRFDSTLSRDNIDIIRLIRMMEEPAPTVFLSYNSFVPSERGSRITAIEISGVVDNETRRNAYISC